MTATGTSKTIDLLKKIQEEEKQKRSVLGISDAGESLCRRNTDVD